MKKCFTQKSLLLGIGGTVVVAAIIAYGWHLVAAGEEVLSCPVYRFECIPRVEHLALERHTVPCTKSAFQRLPKPAFGSHTWQTLAEKGIYAPFEEQEHVCALNQGTMKIKVNLRERNRPSQKANCTPNQPYTIATTWWIENKKVIDNLYLSQACGGYKEIKTLNSSPFKREAIDSRNGSIQIIFSNDKPRWYEIYISPSTKVKISSAELPREDQNIKAPLTNAYVYQN